jgi:hypothetical protein
MKNSSIQVSHSFDNNSAMHTYVVKHDISLNWFFIFNAVNRWIFSEILGKKVEIDAICNIDIQIQARLDVY